jgi:hypothetical protein
MCLINEEIRNVLCELGNLHKRGEMRYVTLEGKQDTRPRFCLSLHPASQDKKPI